MKPVRDDVEVLERGTQLKVAKLSIDEENMEFVMDMLATLYTNPAEAVMREYATNAWDSHVEAGNDAPIEVTLPTRLEPKLYIQDYGVGLSVDELYSMYKNYGSSTKRESDDFTGMLGIGSKSGLSYNDSFTIRAVKDGRYAEIIIARNPDKGIAEMKLLAEGDTDEPNGVLFSIDVIDIREMEDVAKKVFRYWKHGKVLVNGKAPVLIEEGEYIGDNCYLIERDRWGADSEDVIVMGNVAYPTDFQLQEVIRDNRRVVHWAEIGAVAPAPNRESLKNINRTKKYVQSISTAIKSNIMERVQALIDDAPTFADASNTARNTLVSGFQTLEWNGYSLDTTVEGQVKSYAVCQSWTGASASWYDVSKPSWQGPYQSLSQVLSNRTGNNIVVVTNYDNNSFTTIHARKIRKVHDQAYTLFLLVVDGYDKELFKGYDVIDYEAEAKHIKVEENTAYKSVWSKPKTAGRYYVWDAFQRTYNLEDTYEKNKYIYYSTTSSRYSEPGLLLQLYPDHTPVRMTKNRFAKFRREHPNALESKEAVLLYRNKIDATLTLADKLTLGGATPAIRDKSAVLDPDVVSYIEEFEGADKKRVADAQTLYSLGVPITAITNRTEPKYQIAKKYPAIWSMSKQENRIEYVNALYLYRKDN